ncbi:glycosyltransferase [Brevundimonas staleyi]|uniref:Glycosyltransferase n=1 Tax=Brevundimonas staleyi TaxID=74326 RepID=A0ABW0FRR9_9CAUL
MHPLLNFKSRKAEQAKEIARLSVEADTARDRRDWATAAEAYRKVLKAKPERADLWVQLGHAEKERGNHGGAGEAYNQSLRLDPTNADTLLQIGHLRKLQGAIDEAGAYYLQAAELDPSLRYALDELRSLSLRGVEIDQNRLGEVVQAASKARRRPVSRRKKEADAPVDVTNLLSTIAQIDGDQERLAQLENAIRAGAEAQDELRAMIESQKAEVHLVFDISDLVGYFKNARLPTGIQRVQIEVVSGLLREPDLRFDVSVCSFSSARDHWVEVPTDLFLRLSDLARSNGDMAEPEWLDALEELTVEIDLGEAFDFARGAYLINLGTSWWLQNYFLHVREAKERFGIHYIPFVHDMIPIMTPEHCTRPLTQDFISWAMGVFSHADYFFTNSEASKRDLISVAQTLGYTLDTDQVHVVRLDADFRKATIATPIPSTLKRYGLTEGGYVLFVSTIESRKNHLNAFKAWLQLLKDHPAKDVLPLVCVGNRGWLNDTVFAQLDGNPELRSKVKMVSKVADEDLANLYRACAFTIYPSSYEGWGLPVTESLSYGKAALLSDASSLPEAGGDFADFFPLGDQGAFMFSLERLMFDREYRRSREVRIETGFQPRPWADLGREISDQIGEWFGQHADRPMVHPRPDLGHYHWMRRNEATSIAPGMVSPEVFRTGTGWSQPDAWGTWTKPGGGTLTFNLDQVEGPLRLYVGLLGLGTEDTDYIVSFNGVPARTGALGRGTTQWIPMTVPPQDYASGSLHVGIWGSAKEDFSVTTGGVDTRVVSVGLIGFMICREDDYASRVAFTEALTFEDLPNLAEARRLNL